jgi:hypothetical protein
MLAKVSSIPAKHLEVGLLFFQALSAAVAEGEGRETAGEGKGGGDHAQDGFHKDRPGKGGCAGGAGELAFGAGQALKQIALPLGEGQGEIGG